MRRGRGIRGRGGGASGFVEPNDEPSLRDGVSYAATITATQPIAVGENVYDAFPSP